MFDVLIRGGTVVDGTGAPARPADVAVEGGRVVAVEPRLAAEGRRTLEADGLLVAPGFIDIHTHSDFFLLQVPSAESKLRQGVTTEVIGMCGFSPAPAVPERLALLQDHVAFLAPRLPWDWRGFGEWCARLRGAGLSVNVVPFVGHGAIRIAAMGFERRPPTPEELRTMEALVARAMDEGAFGYSTGLVYAPSAFAETEELIALARVAAARGGRYFSHIRGEGPTLETAVAEAIAIGEAAGCPVQIAHLKAAGRENWPKMEAALRALDAARARGVEVTADIYPYTAGSTTLSSLLPPWMHDGGMSRLLERLADPASRRRLLDECAVGDEGWLAANGRTTWEEVLIAGAPACREAEGQTLAALAQTRGRPGAEVLIEVLLEARGAVTMVHFLMAEGNVARGLAHPQVMIGSDSLGLAAGPGPHPGRPHPRMYGTFPRVLGTYVRERRLLGWEEAIRKMTGMPAATLGLRDRGVIRPGAAADLVVLDPATVADRAGYEAPHRYPEGIRWVLVNGAVVLDDGVVRPVPAGRVLTP